MKTIGIVGGIAWPSSIVYYRIINELVAQRLGDSGLHSASLVLVQTDFEEVERNQREGRWERQSTDTLQGKRVLVIGAGDLGQHLRRRLEPFDARCTMVGMTRVCDDLLL